MFLTALKLWPNIIKVVQHWESQNKRKRPNNKSYENLFKCYIDKFIPEKVQFSIDIASQLKGLLEAFQTDMAMVPFLEASSVDIFHMLIKMIVKTEVVDEICDGTLHHSLPYWW